MVVMRRWRVNDLFDVHDLDSLPLEYASGLPFSADLLGLWLFAFLRSIPSLIPVNIIVLVVLAVVIQRGVQWLEMVLGECWRRSVHNCCCA